MKKRSNNNPWIALVCGIALIIIGLSGIGYIPGKSLTVTAVSAGIVAAGCIICGVFALIRKEKAI